MRAKLDDLVHILGSVVFGNLLLVLLFSLNVGIWRGQSEIIRTLAYKGDRVVSTTYSDTYGMEHTVNSPLQSTAEENVRVHKQYLAESFCAFTPANPPDWWHPEDCR